MTSSQLPLLELHEWTVSDYRQLVEVGLLDEDAKVELLKGQIVNRSPIGHAHAATVNYLNAWLVRQLSPACIINVQNPIILDDRSAPEPDLAVLRSKADFYVNDLPGAGDVVILIEIADSSLEKDLQVKAPLYAEAGIPEYWVIDLVKETLVLHRRPAHGQFAEVQSLTREAHLRHELLGDLLINDLFPW
jgi:Uma2 family endonuclease